LAAQGVRLAPGTYEFSITNNIEDNRSISAQSALPPLTEWPVEGRFGLPKNSPGAQTVLYNLLQGRQWNQGTGRALITRRLQRWWPSFMNSLWILNVFNNNKQHAPRLLWSTCTMLLTEWPTGRKMRHIVAPRSPIPPCRFCGAARDCVTHWFGPQSCRVLFDLSATHIALPDYEEFGLPGFITLPVHDSRWFKLMQWFKSIQSLLQWGNPEEGFNLSLLIREGAWIARSSNRTNASHDNLLAKARSTARNRAAVRRKKELRGQLTTCACGLVHRRGQHNRCVYIALQFNRVVQAGGDHDPGGGLAGFHA
jgi:hypothetical protein